MMSKKLLNLHFISFNVLQANQLQKEKEIEKTQDFWVKSENYLVCNPCLFHSDRSDIPSPLLIGKKGNFGYINMSSKSFHITQNKNRHCESPLHLWCVKKFEEASQQKVSHEKKNNLAAKKIIRNALHILL